MIKNKKRKLKLSIIGVLLISFIAIGISYSMFSATPNYENKTETIMVTKTLGLTINYQNFSCSDIVPGDKCTKEFSIENTSDSETTFNIYLEDTINEFYGNLDDFVYTLKENNSDIATRVIVPPTRKEKQYIKVGITIPARTTKNYKLILEYLNKEDIDQSDYQGSEFETIIGVDSDPQQVSTDPSVCSEVGMIEEIGDSCDGTIEVVTLIEGNTCYTKRITNPYCDPAPTPIPDNEDKNACMERLEDSRIDGEEVAIYHDIYYADASLYSQGKNERYVTYCTPYKDGDETGIRYCSKANGKGKCKLSTRDTCSYENAVKDLGRTSTESQTRTEFFMDTGYNVNDTVTNNWHIMTFCTKAEQTSTYNNSTYSGYYYCDNRDTLHDWYASSSSAVGGIDIEAMCTPALKMKCKRADLSTLHTETCTAPGTTGFCLSDGYSTGDTITYGNTTITPGELTPGDAYDCDVNGDDVYDPQTERFYYMFYKSNDYFTADTSVAVLIYYTNTVDGVASNTVKNTSYSTVSNGSLGPNNAMKQLPSANSWSNVATFGTTRAVTNNALTPETVGTADYSGYAARFLTYYEIYHACIVTGTPITSDQGLSGRCQYLYENTIYSSGSTGSFGWWIETIRNASGNNNAFYVMPSQGKLNYSIVSNSYGTRPAIEVPSGLVEK